MRTHLGGAYSFVACLGHLTIDHASLSRRSTVPTPNRNLQHLGAHYECTQRAAAAANSKQQQRQHAAAAVAASNMAAAVDAASNETLQGQHGECWPRCLRGKTYTRKHRRKYSQNEYPLIHQLQAATNAETPNNDNTRRSHKQEPRRPTNTQIFRGSRSAIPTPRSPPSSPPHPRAL